MPRVLCEVIDKFRSGIFCLQYDNVVDDPAPVAVITVSRNSRETAASKTMSKARRQ